MLILLTIISGVCGMICLTDYTGIVYKIDYASKQIWIKEDNSGAILIGLAPNDKALQDLKEGDNNRCRRMYLESNRKCNVSGGRMGKY